MSTTTYLPKPGEIKSDWYVIDATDQVLGRLAAKVSILLQGKNKPTYASNVDTGDHVIILNAEKIRVTGKKAEQLEWDTYSKYPGGRKLYSFDEMVTKHPERLIEIVVKRMMPKSRLGRAMLGKLKVYRGTEHPHSAQQPKEIKL